MAKQPDQHSRHLPWRLALLLLVVLAFLPEITIYPVSALANVRGCSVEGKTACFIGPISVSGTIVAALEAGFLRGAGFSVGIAAAWLALCYVLASLGWARLPGRLLCGP